MYALQLLAVADDYATTTYDASQTAAAGGVIAAIVAMGVFFWIIAIVCGVFTIWMFIDSLIRTDEDYKKVGSGSKVMWALLIFFLNFIPAVLYFFMVRKKIKAGETKAEKK